MVLQRDMEVPIWGTADPGEAVTVSIAGRQAKATAGADGKWMVRLQPFKTSEPAEPIEMTVAGKNTIKVVDILVGEVWLASGQSNMQWPVKLSKDAVTELMATRYPQIRLYSVERAVAGRPMSDVPGKWAACGPETVADFSAVAYFFGRELHEKLEVPVGLVHSSWGGTPAESWTSRPALEADPDLKLMLDRSDGMLGDYRAEIEQYRKVLDAWVNESIAAESQGRPVPPGPKFRPDDPRAHPDRPSGLYNAMIAPLVPLAIRGAIWYQGEANAARAYQYRKLFPAMIKDWRRAWGQGDFPFLFVQLANFKPTGPRAGTWAELREAQTMTLTLKNTGMAVAIDIGDPADIHPKNKQEVGRRLFLAAQHVAYGKQLIYSGPMYEAMGVEANRVRLKFKHANGLKTQDGQPPKGFVIAGEDRKFVDASATIESETVVVWSDAVAGPVAVRYGWNDNPTCTLYNAAGLPAGPFRTDDWPAITAEAN
ncbi:MAG: sialate O-acetylesterase [Planctomycetes bacterium]|nr:sialate O-acetylesterase [Planctomycetota bacterium]